MINARRILDGCCVLATAALVAAYIVDDSAVNSDAVWLKFMHLFFISTMVGVHMWVVFVAGTTMIQILTRSQFTKVQSELFPAFFDVCVTCSFMVLAALLMRFPKPDDNTIFQLHIVGIMAILSVMERFILLGRNTALSQKMMFLEREAGLSEMVGPMKNKELLENPEYRSIKKQFGKWHGIIMSVTMVILGLSVFHLYDLAKKM